MKKRKLCQILYSGLGGHASVAFSLLTADTQKKFDHQFLFFGIEPLLERYRKEVEQAKIPYTSILKKRGFDRKSWKEVYQSLCKLQPDFVILHSTNLILPVAKYCKANNVQLITVEHTAMAAKRTIEHIYARLCGKRSDQIVVLTEHYKQEYLVKYGSRFQHKLYLIPNGIDTTFFAPVVGEKKTVPVISMIGRFSPQKDQLTLIRAVELLQQPVLLKLAGNGDHLEKCKAYVAASHLSEKVQFTGVLDDREIRILLQESTVYVQSSLEENMPTSVMQAMACGVPVIGTNISGISNLIHADEDGWLFEVNDADALAKQLEILLQSNELIQAGKRARDKAEYLFSHTRMLEAYSELMYKQ